MIHGIEECKKGTPRYKRFRCDLNKVNSIITNVENGISPLSVRDHFRLGKYREHSVLIKLNRAIDRLQLLYKDWKHQNQA